MDFRELVTISSYNPHAVSPNAWHGHLHFAFWIINQLKPGVFVELGTHTGSSYLSFCKSVSDNGLATKCFAVDTWQGDEQAGFYGDDVYDVLKHYHDERYSSFSKLLRMTFDEAASLFEDESIELLHIDGLHTYEAVSHDFSIWISKVAPGGVVLFHDINVHSEGFGVWKFWDELKAKYPENLSFLHSNGLGVLRKEGGRLGTEYEWLYKESEKKLVIDYFTSIGEKQILAFDAVDIPNRLKIAEDRVQELSLWGLALDKDIQRLREIIEQLSGQIREKDNTIASKDNTIASFNNQLRLKDSRIVETEAALHRIRSSRKWKLVTMFSGKTPHFVKKMIILAFRINPLTILYRRHVKKKICNYLDSSFMFDPSWYLSQNPDLADSGVDPYLHFYKRGGYEGRSPSPFFDSAWYYRVYPDVKQNNYHPFIHYIKYGRSEGRDCSPVNLGQGYDFERNGKISFPVTDEVCVSIIIPVYNKWMYTRACLVSIFQNTHNIPYEVIIGDDGSSDGTVNIASWFANVRVVKTEKNLGFLGNCDNAAKSARGKYVLFLNNDTIVREEWLDYLVRLIEGSDDIGLVGPKLIYHDGRLQEAGGIIWKDASGWNYGWGDDPEKPEYNYVKDVDYISGACLLVRKSLWNEIGGFDSRFAPAYYEDTDLAFEIRKSGFRTVYQPESEVIHLEGISNGKDIGSGMKRYQLENESKFLEKWKVELEKNHFPNGQDLFHARERSHNKKTILVIDHYVPRFDQDAGSRLMGLYLNLFVDMGYNVKFITDNFSKAEPYSTYFLQKGIEILYGDLYRTSWQDWVHKNSEHIDFVLLNRPNVSVKYIDFIRENTKAKIVYHGVDLCFVREYSQYKVTGDNKYLDSSKKWKQTELGLIDKSDIVITVSEDEKSVIRKETGKEATVFPIYFWDNVPVDRLDFKNRKGLFFVGGFSHDPNVDAVKWFIADIFPMVREKIPGVTFTVAGSNPPDEIKNLASEDVFIKGYISDEDLVKEYESNRIVVIPLRFGAGVKGKTIDSMFRGVPIVSTKFGIEGLENIEKVLSPYDKAEDFAAEVIHLYHDDNALQSKSRSEKEYVARHFSRDVAKSVMAKVFS
jgi:GT2 family glycosyltransferase